MYWPATTLTIMDVCQAYPPRRRAGLVAALVGAFLLVWPSHAAGASEDAADATLRARIEAQLAALPDRDGAEIRIAVREGQVLLLGRVALLEQSLRAEQAVWKTPGVVDVDNELRVLAFDGPKDAEIARRVRTIIKGDARFLDTNLEVEVSEGLVRLRGFFQDPADVLALKHRVASIPGVLDVEIDALLVAFGPLRGNQTRGVGT